jgi:hypothetical protein
MIQWCLSHTAEITAIYFALVGLVSAIVKVIPPLPANHWALPIIKFLGKWIALNKRVNEEDRPQ